MTMHGIPHAARAIGQKDRYSYWRGASGKRYLFTAVPADTVDDFHNGVVLFVANARNAARRILSVGMVDNGQITEMKARGRKAAKRRPRQAFVHLLAASPEERREVIADIAAVL